MTSKDFKVIASTLDRIRLEFDCSPSDDTVSLSLVAEELADALANTNPRFNREMFLTACGVK